MSCDHDIGKIYETWRSIGKTYSVRFLPHSPLSWPLPLLSLPWLPCLCLPMLALASPSPLAFVVPRSRDDPLSERLGVMVAAFACEMLGSGSIALVAAFLLQSRQHSA